MPILLRRIQTSNIAELANNQLAYTEEFNGSNTNGGALVLNTEGTSRQFPAAGNFGTLAFKSKIVTGDITDKNVTTAKLADTSVTVDKLSANAVETGKIKDGAVTTAKLGSGAVTTAKIASGAVTSSQLAANSVTNDKVVSVNCSKITKAVALKMTAGSSYAFSKNNTTIYFGVLTFTYLSQTTAAKASGFASAVTESTMVGMGASGDEDLTFMFPFLQDSFITLTCSIKTSITGDKTIQFGNSYMYAYSSGAFQRVTVSPISLSIYSLF